MLCNTTGHPEGSVLGRPFPFRIPQSRSRNAPLQFDVSHLREEDDLGG